jgi:hypothetical protein
MAEKSNFWGGFWLGTIVGGVTAAIVISRLNAEEDPSALGEGGQSHDPSLKDDLQQKIAQLNAAIDAVSQEISVQESEAASVSVAEQV